MATNSSTSKHEPNDHANLQAPPPTPSNHHDNHDSSSTSTHLSFILNQILIPPLKPILSSPSPISFLLPNHKTKLSLLSTVTHHPFFYLKNLHIHIPSHLPPSSLLESNSLLPSKRFSSLCFNKDEEEDDEDDEDNEAKTLLVLEPTSIDPNTLPSLHEFTQCLQKVAMEVLEMLFDGMLDHEGAPTPRFLIWISKSKEKKDDEMGMEMERKRNIKCYPFVMCMQYEMRGRGRTSWVVGESGELVSIPSRPDSLLVTLGDIAQVWSNGRFKKVRGIPFQSSSSNHDYNGDQSFISLTFMVTLPLESTSLLCCH
ncbi:putative isopenicillin N synthase [Dioscorea sansibarensis]